MATSTASSSERPLSMFARLDMQKSSAGSSLSHLTIKQNLWKHKDTISYSSPFNDETILLNSKSSRASHIKDVFPEYELDEFVSFANDDDIDFPTTTLGTEDSMETTFVDSVSQRNVKWSENVVQKGKISSEELPKVVRTTSMDENSVEIDRNRRLTSAKIEKNGSIDEKQKMRKRRRESFSKKAKRFLSSFIPALGTKNGATYTGHASKAEKMDPNGSLPKGILVMKRVHEMDVEEGETDPWPTSVQEGQITFTNTAPLEPPVLPVRDFVDTCEVVMESARTCQDATVQNECCEEAEGRHGGEDGSIWSEGESVCSDNISVHCSFEILGRD